MPTTTWSTLSGSTAERSSAAREACAQRSMALTSLNFPKPGVPTYSHMGVRAPPTIAMSFVIRMPPGARRSGGDGAEPSPLS